MLKQLARHGFVITGTTLISIALFQFSGRASVVELGTSAVVYLK